MCSREHSGEYGSGRFCSEKCSKGFSTKEKRDKINEMVSKKLKGKKVHGNGFKKGYDQRRKPFTETERLKGVKVRLYNQEYRYRIASWDELPHVEKRRRILIEQNNKCKKCGINEWLGLAVVLELHHKDGNHGNETRNNLEFLCPLCHSLTPNYRRKNGQVAER